MSKQAVRDELFRDWAEIVIHVALLNQDKTFRQLLQEGRIESWMAYYLRKQKEKV